MRILNDAEPLDRTALHQEVKAILQDASGNFPAREIIEDHIETVIRAARRNEVRLAGERVIILLSFDLDDLVKAALLSLLLRGIGQRKFDPVATYVLEKRSTYVASRG